MAGIASFAQFVKDDRGQDLIEYALLLGFIGLALLGGGIPFVAAPNAAVNHTTSAVS